MASSSSAKGYCEKHQLLIDVDSEKQRKKRKLAKELGLDGRRPNQCDADNIVLKTVSQIGNDVECNTQCEVGSSVPGNVAVSLKLNEVQPTICYDTNLSCDEIDQEKQTVDHQANAFFETDNLSQETTYEPSKEPLVNEAAPSVSVLSADSSPAGVSPHNRLDAIDDRENEFYDDDRNVRALDPIKKTSKMWRILEKLDVFRSMPQHPHFRSFTEENEFLREGEAIGYMLSFAAMVDIVSKLKQEDPTSTLEENLEALKDFEVMGFEVEFMRSRLKRLLSIKSELVLFDGEASQLKQRIVEEKLQQKHLKVKAYKNNEKKREIEEAIAKLKEKRQILMAEKQEKQSATIVIWETLQGIQEEVCRVDLKFSRAAAKSW